MSGVPKRLERTKNNMENMENIIRKIVERFVDKVELESTEIFDTARIDPYIWNDRRGIILLSDCYPPLVDQDSILACAQLNRTWFNVVTDLLWYARCELLSLSQIWESSGQERAQFYADKIHVLFVKTEYELVPNVFNKRTPIRFNNLERLSVPRAPQLDLPMFMSKSLKTVMLAHNHISDSVLDNLIRNCPKIESVSMADSRVVKPSHGKIAEFIRSMPLKEMDVGELWDPPVCSMDYISAILSKKELELLYFPTASADLLYWAYRTPLESLKLLKLFEVNQEVLRFFLSHTPNLHKIECHLSKGSPGWCRIISSITHSTVKDFLILCQDSDFRFKDLSVLGNVLPNLESLSIGLYRLNDPEDVSEDDPESNIASFNPVIVQLARSMPRLIGFDIDHSLPASSEFETLKQLGLNCRNLIGYHFRSFGEHDETHFTIRELDPSVVLFPKLINTDAFLWSDDPDLCLKRDFYDVHMPAFVAKFSQIDPTIMPPLTDESYCGYGRCMYHYLKEQFMGME